MTNEPVRVGIGKRKKSVLDALVTRPPVTVRGFHADNGSEFINHRVAALLAKLHIGEFTKFAAPGVDRPGRRPRGTPSRAWVRRAEAIYEHAWASLERRPALHVRTGKTRICVGARVRQQAAELRACGRVRIPAGAPPWNSGAFAEMIPLPRRVIPPDTAHDAADHRLAAHHRPAVRSVRDMIEWNGLD